MSDCFCDRCGDYLHECSTKYTVHIQILPDFDGIIFFDAEDGLNEHSDMLPDAEGPYDSESEDDTFQELSFVLCVKCKQKFITDPFSRGTAAHRYSKHMERLFH